MAGKYNTRPIWFFLANFGMMVLLSSACVFRSIPKDTEVESHMDIIPSRLNLTKKNITGNLDINTTQIIHVTNRKFLSVAIDLDVIRKGWKHFDFNSTKLQNLAIALSPAILRLGGTDADFLIFNDTEANKEDIGCEGPDCRTNFTMTVDDWDKINTFASDVGWDVLFDLNMLLRRGSKWDSTNAELLMQYTKKKGFQIAGWQLGNEPNHIKHHSNITISADQLAKDFITLRQLLNQRGFKDSYLVGPDITHPNLSSVGNDLVGDEAVEFLKSFLRACGNSTQATTWHSYYVNSKYVTPDNLTDYQMMNTLKKQIYKVQQLIAKYRPSLPKSWLGETAGVSGGGYAGYSDAYAGGFLWLDKLGLSARYGVDLVIRQSFYGSHYGLLDENTLDPTPCYWISLLYKQLVGPEVLDLNVTLDDVQNESLMRNSNHVRAYAHCTKNGDISGLVNTNGSITLFIINLQKTHPVSLTLGGQLAHKTVYKYLLLPHDDQGITAKTMDLNGKELMLSDRGAVPDLRGKKLGEDEPIWLPPFSYGFYIVEANASTCFRRTFGGL
ncbi:heparanase-like [Amphiura filiformis]|uniref:heparanase-like n=1 Tax=Amphiura filiformis TaxID=82378 RepID=UPI003B221C56